MSKLRVLIAEDHQEMRCLLIRLLQKKFEIIGAVKDGKDLLDAAILLHPDVIVSDVSMPRLTGPQVMQALYEQGQCIPFVFATTEPGLILQDAWPVVDKLDAHSELIPAVEAVAKGKKFVSRRACSQGDSNPLI